MRSINTEFRSRPEKADPNGGNKSKTYQLQLVTPMFGGGVEPGQPDPLMPIRASSIRGHLRFWWRATRGAQFNSVDELKRHEVAIWGDTELPSSVIVEVLSVGDVGYREPPDYEFPRYGPEAYALFSAKQNDVRLCREGLQFNIRVGCCSADQYRLLVDMENKRRRKRHHHSSLPTGIDLTIEVNTALTAWFYYGGLGARTRRGCGAINCIKPNLPASMEVPGATVLMGQQTFDRAMDAWNRSVSVYQDFRQSFRGKPHDKRRGQTTIRNVPGRSYWPEPDSIRRITHCSLQPRAGEAALNVPDDINTTDHSRPVVPEDVLPSFPRAILGMPIIFHFADGPGRNNDGTSRPANSHRDPASTEIVPARTNDGATPVYENGTIQTHSRLASPVITRPVWVPNGWKAGIIILNRPELANLAAVIRGRQAAVRQGDPVDVEQFLSHAQISDDKLKVIRPMAGHASAIDAFVNFAFSHGFQEVQ